MSIKAIPPKTVTSATDLYHFNSKERLAELIWRFAGLLRDPDLMIEDCREGWSEEVDELLRDAGFKGRMEK